MNEALPEISEFLLVQRSGRVLEPSIFLTWGQAQTVHRNLKSEAEKDISDDTVCENFENISARAHFWFRKMISEDFGNPEVTVSKSRMDHPATDDGGFVYRSKFFLFQYSEFTICLSFSFTICMVLLSSDDSAKTSLSKLWRTANIQAAGNPIEMAGYAELESLLVSFNAKCQQQLISFYQEHIQRVVPTNILKLHETKFEHRTLQIPDDAFYPAMQKLEDGTFNTSGVSPAVDLFNMEIAGISSSLPQLENSEEKGQASFVCRHKSGVKGLYNSSWENGTDRTKQSNTIFGVTSSAANSAFYQPQLTEDRFSKLSRQPANLVAAAVAAKFASVF
jgi:hypothetical protein